ncbi:hypothetical protein BO94DRAFT_468536, partial [Aspergillus sclerotioniger CBS 115572]
DKNSIFLVKLEGPLSSPTKIKALTGFLTTPILKEGEGIRDTSPSNFCLITGKMKLAILSALEGTFFSPTFIRVNLSPKHLSDYSIAPTLGNEIDPTLPQNRATDADELFLPRQDQFPVWYFFYGNLAVSEILAARLGLQDMPILSRALVKGGVLRTWGGGKYKALVDGTV